MVKLIFLFLFFRKRN